MTSPYTPPVLPGSAAEQAVQEVGEYFAGRNGLDIPDLEKFVKQKLIDYGGDRVTAAASSRTVAVLAEQTPGNAQSVAENVVAATVADPAFTSNKVRTSVLAQVRHAGGVDSLSKAEQKSLAFDEANRALREAGVMDTESSEEMKARISEYIDQGASPDVAAAAAVAPQAAKGMPKAESFSIFGYLTLLVHKEVEYHFKGEENMTVGDSAIHTHFGNVTFEMPGKTFLIDCTTVVTSSTEESVRAHRGRAIGEYEDEYKSVMLSSFSKYNGTYKHGKAWYSGAGLVMTGTAVRVYTAITDSDIVKHNFGIDDLGGSDHRWTIVDIIRSKSAVIQSKLHKM